jgi:hypothetical protein
MLREVALVGAILSIAIYILANLHLYCVKLYMMGHCPDDDD